MTPDIPEIDAEIAEIEQIGIVGEDLDEGMERYSAIIGVPEWKVLHIPRLRRSVPYDEENYNGDIMETCSRSEPVSPAIHIHVND